METIIFGGDVIRSIGQAFEWSLHGVLVAFYCVNLILTVTN